MIAKWIALWFPMIVIMIGNAALREKLYGPAVSELAAHQISTLTAVVFIGAYVWLITGFFGVHGIKQAMQIGATWLALTIAFEFLFGHYVMHHSWSRLLADYNIFKGRVWGLFLVWFAACPALCSWLRKI